MALLHEIRPAARTPHWPMASDAELAEGVAAGSDDAFAEIYARYQAPLVRYCRGILLDDDTAQDAVQNTLAKALRALSTGRSQPRALAPWLYRIAQREAVDLARRRRHDAVRSSGDAEIALLTLPAPRDDRVRERLRELVGDLATLPMRQRSALLLRELSGLRYDEIALALETTPDAARQSVLEARNALVETEAGRRDGCDGVRALVGDGDRRRLKSRRVRAHLDDCASCRTFAGRLTDRRRDLALLFPCAPAAIAGGGGALAVVTGGGVAAGGGALAASGWSLGFGASVGAKCALVCATAALVGVGSIAEKAITGHPSPPATKTVAQHPATTTRAPALSPTAAPVILPAAPAHHRAPAHRRTTARNVPAATTTLAVAPVRRARPRSDQAHLPRPAAVAPTATTAPVATTPAVTTPTPVSTPRPRPTAAQLQQMAQAAMAAAAKQAAAATTAAMQQAVQQTVTQQGSTLQQTIQRMTTAALSGVQAQLDLLRQMTQRTP